MRAGDESILAGNLTCEQGDLQPRRTQHARSARCGVSICTLSLLGLPSPKRSFTVSSPCSRLLMDSSRLNTIDNSSHIACSFSLSILYNHEKELAHGQVCMARSELRVDILCYHTSSSKHSLVKSKRKRARRDATLRFVHDDL
jgi:hypothetical protein